MQALAIQFDMCFALNSKMATMFIMGFREGLTMQAIFLDSIFGMSMFVSLCGYMK